jgi:hypothetical protein
MYIQRKDKQCEAKVLARVDGRVLIEAKWGKTNRNIVFVSETYFAEKYA